MEKCIMTLLDINFALLKNYCIIVMVIVMF